VVGGGAEVISRVFSIFILVGQQGDAAAIPDILESLGGANVPLPHLGSRGPFELALCWL
jgi:hypothetical protein